MVTGGTLRHGRCKEGKLDLGNVYLGVGTTPQQKKS